MGDQRAGLRVRFRQGLLDALAAGWIIQPDRTGRRVRKRTVIGSIVSAIDASASAGNCWQRSMRPKHGSSA